MADITNIPGSPFIVDQMTVRSMDATEALQTITNLLNGIVSNGGIQLSQSTIQDLLGDSNNIQAARNRQSSNTNQSNTTSNNTNRRNAYNRGSDRFDTADLRRRGKLTASKFFDEMTDEMENAFMEAVFGSKNPFADALSGPLNNLARSIGSNMQDLSKDLGKKLGNQLTNAFKDNIIGQRLLKEQRYIVDNITNRSANFITNLGNSLNDEDYLSRLINGDRAGTARAQELAASQAAANANNNGPIERVSDEDVEVIPPGQSHPSANANQQQSGPSASDITDLGLQQVQSQASNILTDMLGEGSGAGSAAESALTQSATNASGALNNLVPSLTEASSATAGASTAAASAGEAAATAGAAAGGAAAGAGAAAAAFPYLTIALIAGAIIIDKFTECFGPAIEGFKKFGNALSSSAHRVQSQNAKNLELYQERIKKDMTTLATVPYDIMKEAAEKALSVWDAVLQTVSATQGYDKTAVQELYSNYAQRLKESGLASTVSSADIMENLKSVLDTGLSGRAAEEFAYIATVLGQAVPTQDFFQYAETYASLAANAIKNGADQETALAAANAELEAFASNVLYAGRQISGGFSTSLKNSAALFDDAAKIALTSRVGDVKEISGVLTSVSAIVGAIAPDLANELVSGVVKAATGGNSSDITALRSMTSVGASNTAFLKALAQDPQKIFAELFSNLANLQNMSADNFMEVAEGLSSVFGLSMDAFARVDFAYLADAIKDMDTNNQSLAENIALLASGETTSTAEQLRMQRINEYMIDEGLTYVLDNEVARQVQQHMWDEQLAREIEQNTFAVDLQGAALQMLQGIFQTIQNIRNVLDPTKWFNGIGQIQLTALESAALGEDLAKVIDAQRVGKGNRKAYYNLVEGDKDLDLIDNYPELIGLTSALEEARESYANSMLGRLSSQNIVENGMGSLGSGTAAQESPSALSWLGSMNPIIGASTELATSIVNSASGSLTDLVGKTSPAYYGYAPDFTMKTMQNAPAGGRYYNWSIVSKKTAAASSGDWRTEEGFDSIWDANKEIQKVSQQKVQDFLDTMTQYTADMAATEASGGSVSKSIMKAQKGSEFKYLTQSEIEDLVLKAKPEEKTRSFEDWTKSASEFGITNLAQVLTDYGLTMTDIQGKFQEYETQASSKAEHARQLHEVQFWENVEDYNNNYFPNHFENEFLRTEWMLNWEVTYMTPIRDDLHQLLMDWEDYYIHHTAYTDATKNAFADAIDLANKEKDETGDSVLALAKALTENSNWLQENQEILKDPVMHANVLLSQILVVTEAIMQQNNSTGTTSIPTSLLGLGTGRQY